MRKPRSAYQVALDLLARRDHFRCELEDKLRRRGLPKDEIDVAIARCKELGLVDDGRVAERFVETRAVTRGWGPRRLAAELVARGMSPAEAERCARVPSELADESLRTALRKMEARAPETWWRDGQRRARMVSSLVTRGFEAEVAIDAVDELAASREKDHHALDDQ